MKQQICFYYLGNKAEIIDPLKSYFQNQGIALTPLSIENQNIEKIDYLLLIEPIYIYSKCFVISTIWKNWLFEKKPNAKLIVACFKKSDHSNVLNLLDLPTNFVAWLKNVKPVSSFRLEPGIKENNAQNKSYKFENSWEDYPLPLGIDIKQEIERFWSGHESGYHKIWMQINGLNDLYKKVEGQLPGLGTDGIEAKILETIERWKIYQAAFRFLPFFNKVQAIMDRLQAFKDKKQIPISTFPEAEPVDIKEQLYSEVHRYVYYEEYW